MFPLPVVVFRRRSAAQGARWWNAGVSWWGGTLGNRKRVGAGDRRERVSFGRNTSHYQPWDQPLNTAITEHFLLENSENPPIKKLHTCQFKVTLLKIRCMLDSIGFMGPQPDVGAKLTIILIHLLWVSHPCGDWSTKNVLVFYVNLLSQLILMVTCIWIKMKVCIIEL